MEKRVYSEIIGNITDLLNNVYPRTLNKNLCLSDLLKELNLTYGIELSTDYLKGLIYGNPKQKTKRLYKICKKENLKATKELIKINESIYFNLLKTEIVDFSRDEKGKILFKVLNPNQDILKQHRKTELKTFKFFEL